MRIDQNGNVGIGTTAPKEKLEISGSQANLRLSTVVGGSAPELQFSNHQLPLPFTTFTFGTIRFQDSIDGTVFSSISYGKDLFGPSALTLRTEGGFIKLLHSGEVGIGTNTPGAKLDVNGTARVKDLQITGADVAERFPISGHDSTIDPGTVMEINPDHPGSLRVASRAYSPCVAGVVSGAGGLSVGAVLGNLPGSENAPPIALSGRVWVRCDAGTSVIKPGDLLTSSDTPGCAMKASDRDRAFGTTLGKAMTGLSSGRGLVLVLVNLN